MNTLHKLCKEATDFGIQLLIVGLFTALGVALLLGITGCAKPTPFVDGAEVPAPPGCVAGRLRGVDC